MARTRMVRVRQAALVALGLLSWCIGGTAGQIYGEPEIYGQWGGPYELAVDLYDGQVETTQEIAHAALLPPAVTPAPPASPSTRVFLSCKSYTCDLGNQVYGRAYIWAPDRLGTVQQITLESNPLDPDYYPQDGSQDFFCGGHCFLADGRMLFTNGTDQAQSCPVSMFHGNDGAWVLDTKVHPPTWIKAYGATEKPLERWYPTAILLNDGRVFVHGHTQLPAPSSLLSTKRDQFTWNPSTLVANWQAGLPNARFNAACDLSVIDDLGNYPRVHLSITGSVIWTSARDSGGPTQSRFLNVKIPDCPTSPDPNNPIRWRRGLDPDSIPAAAHADGSSVHYVTWDATDDHFEEAFYLIGGANIGVEGNPSDCASAVIYDTVEKMVLLDSDTYATAQWVSAPPMNSPRVNHNTVIQPDGRILVLKGTKCNGSGFVPLYDAETYLPPEVLDNVASGVDPPPGSWQQMSSHLAQVPRIYHSAAVLIPDGRVVVAGGVNINGSTVPDHTIDIYSPWHIFRTRPAIDTTTLLNPASAAYNYFDGAGLSKLLDFKVTLSPGRTVDRVALIRNGSSTHAFNSDQRYVELRLPVPPVHEGANVWRIRADAPRNAYNAPPGYYLLTVVDSQGAPSPCEWIRVE